MSSYLKLCQDIVSELGLAGIFNPAGAPLPLTVVGNTNRELNNVTRWIHDAALQIDDLWNDWKYLWGKYDQPGVLATNQTLPATTNGVQQWDINKFRWRPAGAAGQWQDLSCYTDRQQFLDDFDTDNAIPGMPQAVTIQPDNSVFLSSPLDASYDFRGEYWQRPIELINDEDVPLMPAQYHRIIMCRAAVMYGNREDAPEVIVGLEAEYMDMLDKLQTNQLEGHALRRSSTDRERLAPTRAGRQNLQQWV